MRFLLVNTNSAVRKIFNITAKKAAIQLDAVSSINEIPLKEDYNCIFIDDGVLNSGDIGNFRNKMITTKFCIILSKDSPLVSGFDSYIRKPFLPTDIYEVMKKEKYNDINISSNVYEEEDSSVGSKNLGDSTSDSVNANTDIDLSEFSDSDDEFLSGTKDKDIDFSGNPLEGNIDLDFDKPKNNADFDLDIPSDSVVDSPIVADSPIFDEADSSKNSIDIEDKPIAKDSTKPTASKPTAKDSAKKPTKDSAQSTSTPQVDVFEEAEAQIKNIKALADKGGNFYNSSNDVHSIDFSQVMALQDELLKEEESKKKKGLIGGDIYTKKEPKKEPIKETPKETIESPKVDSINEDSTQNLAKDTIKETKDSANAKDSVDIEDFANVKEDSIATKEDSANIKDSMSDSTEDSAESLDFLNTQEDSTPNHWTQDFTASQDFSQAQDYIPIHSGSNSTNSTKQNYDDDFSFDSLNGEDFDGLDGLSGISDIKSDTRAESPVQNKPKNANDILNNLDITSSNIDEDYHADSENVADISDANALDMSDFNNAFSQGIDAEMDSISPNFAAQDFVQDLSMNEPQPTQKYNMLGLPIDESGEIKDINDLSDSELEKLDDEALLLLQERALQDKSSEPKILDKQQIDDINNILETTQTPTPSDFSINNNEFGSLTQEALSEVLGEESVGASAEIPQDNFIQNNNFAPNDNFTQDNNLAPNIDAFEPIMQPSMNKPSMNAQEQNISEPSKHITINENSLDIAEIIKTFPIDKLRELLSGVQITINITFPNKKQ